MLKPILLQRELPMERQKPLGKLNSSYYGSKKKLSKWIIENISNNCNTVLDGFSGGVYISFALKEKGYEVISNDFLKYPYTLSKALIENNHTILLSEEIKNLTIYDNKQDNFIEKTFSDIYFNKETCRFIDTVYYNHKKLREYKKWLSLAILFRTCVFKAPLSRFNFTKTVEYLTKNKQKMLDRGLYGKYYRPIYEDFIKIAKIFNDCVFDNKKNNRSYNLDIFELLLKLKKENVTIDTAYYDPPYFGATPHYEGQYHFVEGLYNYWLDKQIDIESSAKRYKNMLITPFTNKDTITKAFNKLFLLSKDIPVVILSYNSKSYPKKEELISIIKNTSRRVDVLEKEHKYEAPKGDLGNNIATEYLFVCE